MYKKHKFVMLLVLTVMFFLTIFFNVDYSTIASEGITVVSIVLAIYFTSFSSLISTTLAREMEKKLDYEINHKSQLGVLRGYLNVSVFWGICNIVISCICLLLSKNIDNASNIYLLIYRIVSSSGFATLANNIFLMTVLYKFMVNRQMWNK